MAFPMDLASYLCTLLFEDCSWEIFRFGAAGADDFRLYGARFGFFILTSVWFLWGMFLMSIENRGMVFCKERSVYSPVNSSGKVSPFLGDGFSSS